MTRIMSENGIKFTESFEGLRLNSYRDVRGILTCGYGHTGSDVHENQTITQEQAEEWLKQDIETATNAVNRLVTNIDSLSQNATDALIDFVYNVGQGNFGSSTLLKLVNANDLQNAALEFPKWAHAGGVIVAGLLRRRNAEAELFLKSDDVVQSGSAIGTLFDEIKSDI